MTNILIAISILLNLIIIIKLFYIKKDKNIERLAEKTLRLIIDYIGDYKNTNNGFLLMYISKALHKVKRGEYK